MQTKRELVNTFEKIENESMLFFSEGSLHEKTKAAAIISELYSFARQVNEFLDKMIKDEETDTVQCEHSNAALASITLSIYNIMTYFDLILTGNVKDYAETKKNICQEEGRIAQILRFEVKCVPQLDIPNEGMRKVYAMLQNLGEKNSDFYTVNYMYQNSVWKYLPQISTRDTAIVMQGPISYTYDFTIETLYRYRNIYKDALIILSTWKGEMTEEFRWRADSLGVVLLENDIPRDRGVSNVKLQLLSSYIGIKRAMEIAGIEYVLKTRTDQRIFLPDFLTYLKNVLSTFKPDSDELSKRVIFLGGHQSSCVCPFEVCDFLAFGTAQDVIKIYESDGESDRLCADGVENTGFLTSRARVLFERSHYDNYQAMLAMSKEERMELAHGIMKYLCPETYIALSYYERVFLKRGLTEKDDIHMHYWDFLKRCVAIVDVEQLFLYWFKYEERYLNTTNLISMGGLTASVWLDIYYSSTEFITPET